MENLTQEQSIERLRENFDILQDLIYKVRERLLKELSKMEAMEYISLMDEIIEMAAQVQKEIFINGGIIEKK